MPRGGEVRLLGPAAKPGSLFFRGPRSLGMAPRRRVGALAGFEHLLFLEVGPELARMTQIDVDLRRLPVFILRGLRCRCPFGVGRARRRRQLPGFGRQCALALTQRRGAFGQGGSEVRADRAEFIAARLQVGMLRVDRLLQRPAPLPVVQDAAHRHCALQKTAVRDGLSALVLAGNRGRFGNLVPPPRRLDGGGGELDPCPLACRLGFAGGCLVLFRSPGALFRKPRRTICVFVQRRLEGGRAATPPRNLLLRGLRPGGGFAAE